MCRNYTQRQSSLDDARLENQLILQSDARLEEIIDRRDLYKTCKTLVAGAGFEPTTFGL